MPIPSFNEADVVIETRNAAIPNAQTHFRLIHTPTGLYVEGETMQGRGKLATQRELMRELFNVVTRAANQVETVEIPTDVVRFMNSVGHYLSVETNKMRADADYKPAKTRIEEISDACAELATKLSRLVHTEAVTPFTKRPAP